MVQVAKPTSSGAKTVQVVVIEIDQFGKETRIFCTDSNAIMVSDTGSLLVGEDNADAKPGEVFVPLHAWAPDRWVKADIVKTDEPEKGEPVE